MNWQVNTERTQLQKKLHLYRDISFIKVSATRNAVLTFAVSLQDLDSGHLLSKWKGLLPAQDCGA